MWTPHFAAAMAAALAAGLALGAALLAPAPASAQAVPATHEMIRALQPAATRNLIVRARPAEAASAPDPTLASAALSAPPGTTPSAPPSLSLAIQFELNSAQVRPESGVVLGNLVAAMLSPELKGSRFLIEGYTDARGAADANQRLSQERAEQVRLYLVALGVNASRLRAVGKGAADPVNPLDPLAAENRRVRVVTVE
jgi:outer membrane protein OmpA-like peptidoglycan-associated protein